MVKLRLSDIRTERIIRVLRYCKDKNIAQLYEPYGNVKKNTESLDVEDLKTLLECYEQAVIDAEFARNTATYLEHQLKVFGWKPNEGG